MSDPTWSLHPQLAADTSPVGDLLLSRLLAIDDAVYPWLVLVPRRASAVEIADLGAEASVLMDEIVRMSRLLKSVSGSDKINVGAIGNVVPQLHIHVVARWKDDPLWPKPVWGLVQPRKSEPANFAHFIAAIREGAGLKSAEI
jgi:diadenosine tetraphosphate (Ap4A) HIT family hydrolase